VLINSLEPDHLDYFGTKDRYHAAYQKFIEKIPADGHLILFARDQQHLDLTKVRGEVHIMEDPDTSRKLYQLRIPGKHNQRNAYAAEQVASVLGVFPEAIKCGLENFNGTWRRFEYKGSVNGAKVYDDYGHHPTEIKATIQGARELYPDQNLVVVFQPHQYSRTAFFLDEFATAFKGASDVWITPIYKVRDSQADVQKVSSEDLVTRINQQQNAELISMEEAAKRINSNSGPSDVYLVMGAGNINGIFSKLFLNL
ncbi:MAG: cyanophycin synthetase, partial [bacterium]|nr:cyanophycin synthetase [bacterium]